MNDEEVIIKTMPGETPEQLQQSFRESMNENLFPETDNKGRIHELFVKLFHWSVKKGDMVLSKLSPRTRRWYWFHKHLKMKIMHPTLWIARRLVGKMLIRSIDEIPAKPWNNLIRIWYHNRHEAIKDIWRIWCYTANMKGSTFSFDQKIAMSAQEMTDLNVTRNLPSYSARKSFLDFEATLVVHDTADRARIECELLRTTRNMMKYYGVNQEEIDKIPKPGHYDMFVYPTGKNPEFFMKFRYAKPWHPEPDDYVESLTKIYQEVIKQKEDDKNGEKQKTKEDSARKRGDETSNKNRKT